MTKLTTRISLLRPDQTEGRENHSQDGQLMCWSKGQQPRNQPTPETPSSVFYIQGVSESEQFNLLLPREQRREINPP